MHLENGEFPIANSMKLCATNDALHDSEETATVLLSIIIIGQINWPNC